MIYVRLMGGLGNQMFQYATARSLALKHNTKVVLDLSWFEEQDMRNFDLGVFTVQIEFVDKAIAHKLSNLTHPIYKPYAKTLHAITGGKKGYRLFKEPPAQFVPELLHAPDNSLLIGYWQSEKYFVDHKDQIRQDFQLVDSLEGKNLSIAEQMQKGQSVSIHFRRTDYVNDDTTSQVHNICDLDYYKRCVDYIVGKIDNPHFFVFSDDVNWVKENWTSNFETTFVDHNSMDTGYLDMVLMSKCKHNIMANSSFSWWASWLNTNPEKIVLAPKKWFHLDVDYSHIYRPDWVCL